MCDCQKNDELSESVPVPDPAAPARRDYVAASAISGTLRYSSQQASLTPSTVLVADDDLVPCHMAESALCGWGYKVVIVRDGTTAWEVLQQEDCPKLALIDWMMPGLEGPEVCRRVRALARAIPPYLILLTGKGNKDDIVTGLESGADDFVTKPFDRQELRSRLRVGERMVGLHQAMADRVRELETVLGQVKQLSGLLPICSYCKKVRDDGNYWQRVETYITAHSNARFSHGICPDCWRDVIEPEIASRGLIG